MISSPAVLDLMPQSVPAAVSAALSHHNKSPAGAKVYKGLVLVPLILCVVDLTISFTPEHLQTTVVLAYFHGTLDL